ncbi:hypothetical protein OEZ85_005152 [Tetradesmus obliquus]|uniref:Uncharacterized protein n=1 Tax=Tetradesmus obliquus TaxID=3088 RepID=A0ABY8UKF8_TETOB|nr:hypothetical protein OEZ85_005152 [Tetradesmus obliquus]
MSSIKRITNNACTFRGFRTWGDVAALWSSPGVGTVFRAEDLKTPSGVIAMLGHAGFPAITCDCSKLPQAAVFAAKPECRGGPLGQVHLNAALSNTGMTGLPWKLGTPLLAGCRA